MITHPDYYGIDTPDPRAACSPTSTTARRRDVPVHRRGLAAASSRSTGSIAAVGGETRNNAAPQFTDHYFTGDYPTTLTDLSGRGKSDPKSPR